MKVIVKKQKESKHSKNEIEYKLNSFIEWLIYMCGYAIVLIMASGLFRSIYVESFLYGFLASILIFIFNKTIKPILVTLSLPLIGVSLGLFYFVINVLILWIVSFILKGHFILNGLFSPFIISIFISFMNIIVESLIIKPLIRRCKN